MLNLFDLAGFESLGTTINGFDMRPLTNATESISVDYMTHDRIQFSINERTIALSGSHVERTDWLVDGEHQCGYLIQERN